MGRAGEMELKPFNGEDYTCITFQPDLSKFKMQSLDKDIVALMVRRAYDIAGSTKDVKVFLNGNKLPVRIFLGVKGNREGIIMIIVRGKIDFFLMYFSCHFSDMFLKKKNYMPHFLNQPILNLLRKFLSQRNT